MTSKKFARVETCCCFSKYTLRLTARSKSVGSSLQRRILGSRFDHVAAVIKSPVNSGQANSAITIFESIDGSGVHQLEWDTFKAKNWHHLYNKIVFRRLNFARTPIFLHQLERFVKSTLGKSYEFMSLPFSQKKGYFCSELIARLYLELKLTQTTNFNP